MDIDDDVVREIAISGAAVGVFVALIIAIGVTFSGGLGQAGGLALVGAIALFILVMAAVGFVLSP